MQVIETPPKFRIELAQLFRCVEVGEEDVDNEEAELEARVKALERGEDLMQEARQHLGKPDKELLMYNTPGVSALRLTAICSGLSERLWSGRSTETLHAFLPLLRRMTTRRSVLRLQQ